MKQLLRLENISKNFGIVQALKDVKFDLKEGEVHALMGENGAGKSTLMNILCGAIKHYDGHIYINDLNVQLKNPHHANVLGISKIHQELQLMPEMSVAENIFMGREPVNKLGIVNHKILNKRAQEYFDMLDIHVKPKEKLKNLRVGERQLIEIAKAISMDAKILIMDEPTSSISEADSEKLFGIIDKLKKKNVGIIYITHRMDEIFKISDRLTVMRDGKYIDTVDVKDATRDMIIKMMVNRSISELYPKKENAFGKEVFRVENLCYKPSAYTFSKELKNITLSVKAGEILGIAGLVGAGRSEFLECIYGMHTSKTTGDVYIDNKKVHFKSPEAALMGGVAFATEDRKATGIIPLRSIGENMSLPLLKAFSKFSVMKTREEQVHWKKQINDMSIKAPSYKTLVKNLSGGNQQKVILGRCLMVNPKLLLLDEPTRGIDVGAKQEIYNLTNKLAERGMAIIVVSSELPEVIGMADRIVTFCEGRLTGEFMKADATQEKLLNTATLN